MFTKTHQICYFQLLGKSEPNIINFHRDTRVAPNVLRDYMLNNQMALENSVLQVLSSWELTRQVDCKFISNLLDFCFTFLIGKKVLFWGNSK